MAFQPNAFQSGAFQIVAGGAALSATIGGTSGLTAAARLSLSATLSGSSSFGGTATIPGALSATIGGSGGISAAAATLSLRATIGGTSGVLGLVYLTTYLNATLSGASGLSGTAVAVYVLPGYAVRGQQAYAALIGSQSRMALKGQQSKISLIGMPQMNNQDITIFVKGENWLMDVIFNDASGSPLNLTGLTGAAIQFKISGNGPSAQLGDGITITNASQGKCSVNISPVKQTTAGVTGEPYTYEARVTLSDGTITSQVGGLFKVGSSLF